MLILLLSLIFTFSGCKSSPIHTLSEPSMDAQAKIELDARYSKSISQRFKLVDARKMPKYLEKLMVQLSSDPLKLQLVDSKEYVLESGGSRTIVVSNGVLKQVQFENELAFLFAREISNLKAPSSELDLDRAGLKIAYEAGFDPRGAVTFLERLAKNPSRKNIPSTPDRLANLREDIAKLVPLRNPVVTSSEFTKFIQDVNGWKKPDDRKPAYN